MRVTTPHGTTELAIDTDATYRLTVSFTPALESDVAHEDVMTGDVAEDMIRIQLRYAPKVTTTDEGSITVSWTAPDTGRTKTCTYTKTA